MFKTNLGRKLHQSWYWVNQIWSWYVFIKNMYVFIENQLIESNRTQSLKILKQVKKRLLYPCFDFLIPTGFHAVKISIFQDSFCCNLFYKIWYYCRCNQEISQTSMIEPLQKLIIIFFAVNYFRKRNSVLHIWQGPKLIKRPSCYHIETS